MSCDYRKNYKSTSAIYPQKTNTSLNDSSDIELYLKPSSIIEEDAVLISKTNTSLSPAHARPTPTQESLISGTNPSSISTVATLINITDTPPATPFYIKYGHPSLRTSSSSI